MQQGVVDLLVGRIGELNERVRALGSHTVRFTVILESSFSKQQERQAKVIWYIMIVKMIIMFFSHRLKLLKGLILMVDRILVR